MRPPKAPIAKPPTSLDVARMMTTFGPMNIIVAFYRALASAAANELEAAAKRKGTENAAKPEEQQQALAAETEEEDVIDKVVKLYDVY